MWCLRYEGDSQCSAVWLRRGKSCLTILSTSTDGLVSPPWGKEVQEVMCRVWLVCDNALGEAEAMGGEGIMFKIIGNTQTVLYINLFNVFTWIAWLKQDICINNGRNRQTLVSPEEIQGKHKKLNGCSIQNVNQNNHKLINLLTYKYNSTFMTTLLRLGFEDINRATQSKCRNPKDKSPCLHCNTWWNVTRVPAYSN